MYIWLLVSSISWSGFEFSRKVMADQPKDQTETKVSEVTSKMEGVSIDGCAGDCKNSIVSKESDTNRKRNYVDPTIWDEPESKVVEEVTEEKTKGKSSYVDPEVLEAAESNVDKDDAEEAAKEEEEDFEIDEIFLKDQEVNMTDDEKEKLKHKGQELKVEGNSLFKEAKYQEALNVYTLALRTCPLMYTEDRSVLYSNRAACFQHLDKKEAVTGDCTMALELNPLYVKARLRRAQNYEALDKLDEALDDYKKILETEPLHRDALYACHELPPRIHDRNEKLKTEMLGKLKDLGNLVLRPFGLSTENFKMQQDPSTGSYSINFQK